jgi:myo-inositol 2-dehydrogenase/D-chiro-inositol 1-dehydrogenase
MRHRAVIPGRREAASPESSYPMPQAGFRARAYGAPRNDGEAVIAKRNQMKQVEAAVIGTGWCGGIRAEALARSALVDKLHICEIRPDRLAEVKALTNPATATLDYQDFIKNDAIKVVYICTTPEQTHYPITRDCLRAGKHVLLEKPIALEFWEADELITLARRNNVKFTIGYSQRFNPKVAYAKKKIADGTLGKVVSVMVSRHLSRSLGKKIASRVRLSPAVMESTHDLDFVFWLLEPAKPVRVYAQGAYGYMQPINGSYDVMWSIVTMSDGTLVAIGGGWNLPPSYPNYCATWIEITGTEGSLFLDDTQRDNWLNTVSEGTRFPMSTMPGEHVDHVFAGQMGPETIHFLESCILDRPPMVAPEHARTVMEAYTAADLSAEINEPVDLPLSNKSISAIADMKGAQLEKVG